MRNFEIKSNEAWSQLGRVFAILEGEGREEAKKAAGALIAYAEEYTPTDTKDGIRDTLIRAGLIKRPLKEKLYRLLLSVEWAGVDLL